MSEPLPVRDAAAKLARYESGWVSYIPRLEKLLANGASSCELLDSIDTHRLSYRGFIPETIRRQIPRLDLGDFGVQPKPYRLAVAAGQYVAVRTPLDSRVFFDRLERGLDPEVDAVVEFGSGMGNNLARLRSRCPGRSPTYIACEPSASGRRITEMLFANDPGVRLETYPFDFNRPTLDFLSAFRKVVAFTCHAVEQVAFLGDAFYRCLLDSPVDVCLHFEPIGWQRYTHLAGDILKLHQDAALWKRYHDQFVYRIADDALTVNAASWSSFCYYNTDLLKVVASAVERGEIRLTALGYDLEGSNPFNPSSLIEWTRCR